MTTQKKNSGRMWVCSALCLAALGLTNGTGCDLQGSDSQAALEAAMNPSATMARLFYPVIESRIGRVDSADLSRLVRPVIETRLEKAESSVTARFRFEAAEPAPIDTLR